MLSLDSPSSVDDKNKKKFRFSQAFVQISSIVNIPPNYIAFIQIFRNFWPNFCQFCSNMLKLLTVVLLSLSLKIEEGC